MISKETKESLILSLLNLEKSDSESETQDHGICIVILQRGWVYVGHKYQKGNKCWLENPQNIRNWGTSKGLGELSTDGPTSNTKLDPCKTVRYHELTEVHSIDCEESKWKPHS